MAARRGFPVACCNHPGVTFVAARLTFAADAETNGCAVTKSNGWVSSCTRTAEGIWTVDFADRFYRCLGMLETIGLAGNLRVQATAQSINDPTPTVTLTFETGSTGSDIDPDSEVVDVCFMMKNSQTAEGA